MRMTRLIFSSLALAALCCLGSIACQQTTAPLPQSRDDMPAALRSALPPIPLGRETSATTFTLNGAQTYMRSAGASNSGTSLSLNPAVSPFEWGVWEFNPAGGQVASLEVQLAASGVWMGIANYTMGTWEIFGSFTSGQTFPVNSTDHISPSGTLYCFVLATSGHSAVVSKLILSLPNNSPTVTLTANPPQGNPSLPVLYTATASDSDGTIIQYKWDLDGDGLYETMGASGGTQDTRNVTYTAAGQPLVGVEVKDNDQATATDSISVTVHGWVIASPNPATGGYFSLAVVNGNPAFSYTASNSTLCYVRAIDARGSAWGLSQPVDTTHAVGSYCSLAVLSGFDDPQDFRPAIAYYDPGTNYQDGEVRFVVAKDADGSAWDTPTFPDPSPGVDHVGLCISMAVVNRNPAICYWDGTNCILKYIRAKDPKGSAWNTAQPLDTVVSGIMGSTHLAVVNGDPAISYYIDEHLRYVRGNNPDGSGLWGTPVDPCPFGNDVGQRNSLAVVNGNPGNPAIAFCERGSGPQPKGILMYVASSDANGSSGSWGVVQTLDQTASYAGTSLAMVNGTPAIAYSAGDLSGLKYIRANDPAGSQAGGWQWPPDTVDTGQLGGGILAVVDGNPAILYKDGNLNIKYARLY